MLARGGWLTRAAPAATVLLLIGPVICGFLGTLLPAFGFLPGLGGKAVTLDHFRALFEVPGLAGSVGHSLLTGLASTLASLLITGIFIASHFGTRAFAVIRRLIAPLLAVPHAAAAFGLAFLIAPSGLLLRLVSPSLTGFERPPDFLIVHDPLGLAMIAGLIAKEIPFLFLISLAVLPQSRSEPALRLGRSLGYGRVASFVFLVWPSYYRQIRLAVLAVLAYATSVVDVALILGPQLPPTLPVRLLDWMNDPDLTRRYLASAGAILQLAVGGLAILVWFGLERVGAILVTALRARGQRCRKDGVVRSLSLAGMGLAAATVLASIVVLGIWSVAGLWPFPEAFPQTLSWSGWQRALAQMCSPLTTTLIVAIIAALISVVLTLLCLENEFRDGQGDLRHSTAGSQRESRSNKALLILYLPLIVPQISFLFGMQYVAILSGLDATFAGLTLAHLVFVLPYVFLSLSDPWRGFDRRFDTLAAGLGMSRQRALWRIRLPMLSRAILTAFAVGFAVSVGQYLPTVLIGAGRLTTITSEAVALSSGGNRRVVGVYGLVQSGLPFLAFAIAIALPVLLFRNRRGLRV
ncbi:ABC transporter permease [Pseudohoeflea coraliihabitans]|uniref:ABC transporter permease subunit n=1 Tax=Pseudohoeflea coraliihabitans TaxID=2860393 RepID=A0ABS6WSZ1_9HYPH|nr:ABC transporter permease subunit [Pseudohoeflea sp. DP4N28-3]MBW3099081.1 ABC transporter permease subunit [Pseudohoeflea sp. DP4N28-3]